MKRIFVCLLGLMLLMAGCSSVTDPGTTDDKGYQWPEGSAAALGLDNTEQTALEQACENLNCLDGLLLIHQGTLVFEYYGNSYNADKAHPWHSATKSVIGALVGVMRGRNGFDSTAQAIVPFFREYTYAAMDERWKQITIEHLLQMTSGIASDDATFYTYDNAFTTFLHAPLISDPGAEYHYSGMAVHGLALLIALQTGRNAASYARLVFGSTLDIEINDWATDSFGYSSGGTGLEMTPRDMARIGYCYLRDGAVDGQQVIPSEWTGEVTACPPGSYAVGPMHDVGYRHLWWTGVLAGHPVFTAMGYAGQLVMGIPDLNLLIVTTAQSPLDGNAASAQTAGILNLIATAVLNRIN